METSQRPSLVAGIAGIASIVVATIPALKSIVDRWRLQKRNNVSLFLQDLYHDRDGRATEESTKAFSDSTRRASIAILSLSGLLVSLALAVLTTAGHQNGYYPGPTEQWFQFATWALLVVQAVSLFAEPSPQKRFSLGLYNATACAIFIVVSCAQVAIIGAWLQSPSLNSASDILVQAELIAAFLICCVSVLLPRRPDVFRNDKAVDRQFTTSFLGRISFDWAGSLLRYAKYNQGLSIDDLPELDYATRSQTLLESFENRRRKGQSLWKVLANEYFATFVLQFIFSSFVSVVSFAPQVALLGILRSLEARSSDSWNPVILWLWVFALGGSIIFYSTVESWLFWVAYYKLAIPVYEQLSAVVFAKSLRRKDVKGSQKSSEENLGVKVDTRNDEEDDDEDTRKTRQATINLIAVDAKRISDFASFNCIIIETIVKLAVAFAFLIRLIGWKSLCAGLLVALIITPLNIMTASRYSAAQTSLMKFRDQKMAVITEALQGIRQIKFSALEGQWEQKIFAIRNTELHAQWMAFIYDVCLISIWILGPIMLSVVSLGTYALIYGELSASVAFTTMAIFSSLEFSLAILPELIADFIEAFVSAKRVEKHLASADRTQTTIPADNITFKRATVAWPTEEVDENDERFALKEVDLAFPPKGLSVISGKTGSGKSLLLAAIIGEADIIDGEVHVPVAPPLEDRFDDHATKANWIIDSAIAYVSQVPWIENASIKDNILFGLPLDAERYEKVLFACALEKDFEMLPDGELTDIGASGINLSGGQKWRVSFARALYSRAGILVMDDLFSALDAHTGRHLHVHALTGELCHGRTRILVTHHVGLCLPQADYSVHLERGIVQHAGSVVELRRTGSLADILTHPQGENLEGRDESEETVEDEAEESNALQKIIPHRSQRTTVEGHGNESLKPQAPKKFQQEEKRETGAIKLIHYIQYFQNGGGLLYWSFVFFTFCAYAGLAVSRSWWVSIWTRSSGSSASGENLVMISHVMAKSTQSNSDHGLWFYLGIYFGLSAMSCLVGTLRYLFLLRAAIRSSRNLFKKLTYTVLRAPLRWLDTVPVGRILNRFTADFNLVDSKLPYELGFMLYNVLNVIGIAVAGFLVSPLLIVFAILLLAICMYFAQCFLSGAREIKRLESNAKSPIFEQFGSALIGLTTIRAFGKAQTYVERMYRKIDHHAQAYWNLWLFNRWLSFRMNVVGALFSTLTAGLVVSLRNIDAPLAGFALSFALQYTASIMWALRQYTNVELDMNATERVLEYSAIDIENQEGAEVPAAWPTEGRLEVTDLVVGYAPDLPPVLRGLSFTVAKNQRVGVVGRTGAGKSSLTLALFRFLEAWEGSIVIDGIDVSKIKLHDLRSRMAIIPQDPVLFSGSIKSNLDPFEEYSDAELRDALERVHLISDVLEESTGPHSSTHSALQASGTSGCTTPTLSSNNGSTAAHTIDTTNTTAATSTQAPNNNVNIFTNLNSTISEGGLNLSQGQRQLLCLARAIVSKPKIMVLDEATSAVDMATDALIQRSIRTEFGRNSTTLLVIAHRLSTIADFDKILVMDAGKAVEFGPPRELMEIQGGVFRSLVEESGEREALEKVILGEQE
ncbi:canalicular multispecific organic anion transporter 1 [Coccidioides immitis RMSCC 2394]|uniref:Canalicular multispecific organic anion transporter 1 n=1 Tax=Coccidioides immitis RMSCC 2394 TaxID=404692 RepID=A0A0J6YIX9_COCIT|nr:canalicular multispecific organic anion transporter 1 [Coccidioides immitis RMSCC 2394]